MSSFLGIKRGREDLGAYERGGAGCCTACLLRHRRSSVADRRPKEGTALLATGRHLVSSGANECEIPSARAPVLSAGRCGAAVAPIGGRLVLHRRSGARTQTVNVGAGAGRTSPSRDRTVVVNVTRGDTGKCCCFTFAVPSRGPYFTAREDKETNVTYRDTVVRELLSQVFVEAALALDRAWVFVYYGKDIQSETGADSLVSALCSESCHRIALAVFHDLETE